MWLGSACRCNRQRILRNLIALSSFFEICIRCKKDEPRSIVVFFSLGTYFNGTGAMNIKKNLGVKDHVDHWTWYNAAVKLISKENNETITTFFRYWLACFIAPLYHTHQKHGKSLNRLVHS